MTTSVFPEVDFLISQNPLGWADQGGRMGRSRWWDGLIRWTSNFLLAKMFLLQKILLKKKLKSIKRAFFVFSKSLKGVVEKTFFLHPRFFGLAAPLAPMGSFISSPLLFIHEFFIQLE